MNQNPNVYSKNEKEELNNNIISKLENINSKFILKKIFNNLSEKQFLKIINYNKNIQNKLGLSINNYIDFTKIIIEIIPVKNYSDNEIKLINISNEKDKSFFHLYLNENENELNKNILTKNEINKIDKIKIIIDNQIKSFHELFRNCKYIESINFIRFKRENIIDMSYMFAGCKSLKNLNISHFITNKVTNMSCMFSECSSLKELN